LGEEGKALAESAEALNACPGPALFGLMLSQRHRPAAWKTDLVRKAVAYYHPWWKANKNMAFVPAQTAAYAEAYRLTKEPAFAACVLEMNDWLCGLQFVDAPPVPWWYGGFRAWKDGRAVEEAPTVAGAAYGATRARASRVARDPADEQRHKRYTAAAERHLAFLEKLQYTTANTNHFDPAYRQEWLCGGFHASLQDGNLRID